MSTTSVISGKNVQMLIKTFDLEMPEKTITLNVTDYYIENGFIIIERIDVLDDKGDFKKEADLEKVLSHLHDHIVTFKKL